MSEAEQALQRSFDHYRDEARRARTWHQASEIGLLAVAALVPLSAALTGDARWAALLGTVVVVLVGLRWVFEWHDDWLRCTETCARLEAVGHQHASRVPPFDGPDRDRALERRVRAIEMTEGVRWLGIEEADDTGRTAPATS